MAKQTKAELTLWETEMHKKERAVLDEELSKIDECDEKLVH